MSPAAARARPAKTAKRVARPALPELHRLFVFATIAEELHFGRAAEHLGVSQSPLSRIIKKLEDDLGVVLFVRSRRSVVLTRQGEELYEEVKALFTAADAAVKRVRSLRSKSGTVTKGGRKRKV